MLHVFGLVRPSACLASLGATPHDLHVALWFLSRVVSVPLCCACVPPQVTVAVRLAVGFTPTQQAAHTDVVVANWLSQPSNIAQAIAASGIANPIGPDALVKWLIKPEIWHAVVRAGTARAGRGSSWGPGAAAVAAFAVRVALVVYVALKSAEAGLRCFSPPHSQLAMLVLLVSPVCQCAALTVGLSCIVLRWCSRPAERESMSLKDGLPAAALLLCRCFPGQATAAPVGSALAPLQALQWAVSALLCWQVLECCCWCATGGSSRLVLIMITRMMQPAAQQVAGGG